MLLNVSILSIRPLFVVQATFDLSDERQAVGDAVSQAADLGSSFQLLVKLFLFARESFGNFDVNHNCQITSAATGLLTFAAEAKSGALWCGGWNSQFNFVAKVGFKANGVAQHCLRDRNSELNLDLRKSRLK